MKIHIYTCTSLWLAGSVATDRKHPSDYSLFIFLSRNSSKEKEWRNNQERFIDVMFYPSRVKKQDEWYPFIH